jgi:hypothetical protein
MATVRVLEVEVLADATVAANVRYVDGKYESTYGKFVGTFDTYDEALADAVDHAEEVEATPADVVTKRELLDQIANLQATVALQDEQIAAREKQIADLSRAVPVKG